jgi:hypothetical protein
VNRRRDDRKETSLPATLEIGGVAHAVEVVDRSEGGLGITCTSELLPGERGVIRLPREGTRQVEVRHTRGGHAGLVFLDAAIEGQRSAA